MITPRRAAWHSAARARSGCSKVRWYRLAAGEPSVVRAAPSSSERDWLELGRIGWEAAARQDDQRAHCRLLINTGIAHRALNNFSEGLDALGRAAALARCSQSRVDEARALNLIGLIHLRRRELELAESHFVQAMSVFRDLGNSQRVATALSNIASTRLSAGRLLEAASVINEALAAQRDLGNRGGEDNLLRIAAELRLEEGDTDAARRSIDEALDIALALRDHAQEGFWLLTLELVPHDTGVARKDAAVTARAVTAWSVSTSRSRCGKVPGRRRRGDLGPPVGSSRSQHRPSRLPRCPRFPRARPTRSLPTADT